MKKILLMFLLIFSFSLFGCNKQPIDNSKESGNIEDDKKEDNPSVEPVEEPILYTVTFDIADCELISGSNILQIKDINELSYPTVSKKGYNFIGWEPNIDKIESDIIFTPIFEILHYTVSLYDESGIYDTFTYSYGDKLGALPYNELEGRIFLGYFNNDVKVDENTIVSSDLNLYSRYEETLSYSVERKIIELEEHLDYDLMVDIKEILCSLDEDNLKEIKNLDSFYAREKKYLEHYKLDNEQYLLNWLNYVKTYNYPTNNLSKDYYEVSNALFNLTIDRSITSGEYNPEQVFLSCAKAVLNKGNLNQYDQKRRVTGFSPYDATEYDTLYMDCSAYTDAMYKYALKQYSFLGNTAGICDYAKNHQGSAEVIYYIDTQTIADNKKEALLKEIYANLRPGDIISYRHGKSSGNLGHAMLYLGDGLIIHSTGDDIGDISYDGNPDHYLEVQTDIEKSIGTVFTFSADELFLDNTTKRYLFRETASDTVYRFCVIRPLNKYTEFTDAALSQYLLEDIDISKTSSAGSRTGIGEKEVVKFTITFTNYSARTVENIPIYQEINDCYDIIDCGDGYLDNDKLCFVVTVPANKTVKISYKVRPKQNVSNTLVDGKTHILNLTLNEIKNTLCINYNKNDFKNNILSCVNNSYSSFYQFIKDVYCNYNLEYANSLTSDTNIVNKNYVVPLYTSSYKRFLANGFSCGDIISFKNSVTGVSKKYLFIDDKTMYLFESNSLKSINGKENVQKILDTLYAQSNVQIIRPLMNIK